MLVLSRKVQQTIEIDGGIVIKVLRIRSGQVEIGIEGRVFQIRVAVVFDSIIIVALGSQEKRTYLACGSEHSAQFAPPNVP